PATADVSTLSLHDALPISRLKSCSEKLNNFQTARGVAKARDALRSHAVCHGQQEVGQRLAVGLDEAAGVESPATAAGQNDRKVEDRKSTRLNSSHRTISYA